MTCIIYLMLALGCFLLMGSEIVVLFAFMMAPFLFIIALGVSAFINVEVVRDVIGRLRGGRPRAHLTAEPSRVFPRTDEPERKNKEVE